MSMPSEIRTHFWGAQRAFPISGNALDLAFTPQALLSEEIIPRNAQIGYALSPFYFIFQIMFPLNQRFFHSRVQLEFLTGCFEGLPRNCDRQLWDFAYAGANIDVALLPRHRADVTSLVEQVQQWASFASSVIPHPSGETMTAWWIGINDTSDTVSNSSITDINAFWEKEMTSYFKAVQQAFDNGLTTHLFLNVPPEDRAPGTLGNPTKVQTMKDHIALFNQVLANHIANFTSANPDATVMTFDANAWFNSVLDDPASFGFNNVTGFCTCADPAGFFWFNSGHPTERVHRLLAEAIEARLISASVSDRVVHRNIDAALLPRHHNETISLVEQVQQWASFASSVIPHPSGETMAAWWIGINDTGDTLSNSSITDFEAFWETEMTSYFKAVQLAFDNGLTTHLFLNVPPEDRAPGTLGNPTKVQTMKDHIALFNQVLANHIANFTSANPDATVMTFDANAWFNSVLDDPASFGFTNVTGFCTCADPAGFFWFNSGHPTERVHRLLAEAIEAQLVNASASEKVVKIS
ncbi:hypothetical protein D9758_002760 [Tetrapyrgos nigripes]|uniref:Carbohydrate esterase family 16 protein n=1 Tax=Tetrapyrgos nigripes TaxID=182062 RepID=A0A8H5LTV4_9AGAR|nr:hypothetical protein D9758_002760 [Tetrapyrgos nigripes]